MPISMEALAKELQELRTEFAADQVFLRIAIGHLKTIGFINKEFLDGIIEAAETDLARNPDKNAIISAITLRAKSLFPQG